ncbi:amidohydrolase family protein [Streptomyces fuscichromogenes]|uniref:amidohydrolase family protein n=1 Tax=Streptomyces fuscichromogenes TaxID=1324013 RepID=UPI0037F31D4D
MAVPLPHGACDTHVHVFGPVDRYPYAPDRGYTPPDALPAELTALHRRLGITRTVLIQPSPYGTDNSRLLDALGELVPDARGVAVVAPDADPGLLRAMREAGVCGARVNLKVRTTTDVDRARRRIEETVRAVGAVGWHLELHADTGTLTALADTLGTLPVPVVLDHFARITPGAEGETEALKTVLRLLESGHVWLKLSAPYRVADDYPDLRGLLASLVAARPDRLLWGSDWPHTGGTPADRDPGRVQLYLVVDDEGSVGSLAGLLGAETVQQVFTANPATLYGFA